MKFIVPMINIIIIIHKYDIQNMLSIKKYNYKNWKEMFPESVDLCKLPIYSSWKDYFNNLMEHKLFQHVETMLTNDVDSGNEIFPYPEMVFNAFNHLDLDNVRVVILGQDPYPKSEECNGKKIPLAMGTSFSVPIGIKIPSSLYNIFKNQTNNHVINNKQPHGNLQSWIVQGCLMLNTALTVREEKVNSHSDKWQPITDKIIKHISNECNDIVFVLWGADALKKCRLIDLDKHKVIMSSHPSGFSYDKPVGNYPPFAQVNHFKLINDYLTEAGHDKIVWQLF